jgi:hypothetical protein
MIQCRNLRARARARYQVHRIIPLEPIRDADLREQQYQAQQKNQQRRDPECDRCDSRARHPRRPSLRPFPAPKRARVPHVQSLAASSRHVDLSVAIGTLQLISRTPRNSHRAILECLSNQQQ